jgi:DNA adenine methylase
MKPFLTYAGSKFSLAKDILSVFSKRTIKGFVEPFLGGGGFFLECQLNQTEHPRFLLNDINKDLIELYKFIQKDPIDYIKEAKKFFEPDYQNKEKYLEIRERFNKSTDPKERSILFLYLNKKGFNGLTRYNNEGKFNVPFGGKKAFPEKEILYFSSKLQNAELFNLDFMEFLKLCPNRWTCYADPPYLPLNRSSNFSSYYGAFLLHQHVELRNWAMQARERDIETVISNHDTMETRELYAGARIEEIKANRKISCKASSRGKVKEILACYDC